jgi:hypothetical protein
MKMPDQLNRLLRVPPMTHLRMGLAVAVAVVADGLQFCTGFMGWAGFDEVIDVVTMILVTRLIGFHILLLPTFMVEMVPVLDDLPTWTACVIAVCVLRRREQKKEKETPKIE